MLTSHGREAAWRGRERERGNKETADNGRPHRQTRSTFNEKTVLKVAIEPLAKFYAGNKLHGCGHGVAG